MFNSSLGVLQPDFLRWLLLTTGGEDRILISSSGILEPDFMLLPTPELGVKAYFMFNVAACDGWLPTYS